jgi:hypothetical protein
MFRRARVVVCPHRPALNGAGVRGGRTCRVIRASGRSLGPPSVGGPSVPIRVSGVLDGRRERQRALRAKGTRRGSVL